MTIKFTIEAPILDESAIESARRSHARRGHLYIALAVLTPTLAAISVVVASTQPYQVSASESRLLAMLLLASVLPALFFILQSIRHLSKAERYRELPPSLCEKALALAGKHPELENYRKLIAGVRQFKRGDYVAMDEFDKNKAGLEASKALHQVNEP